MNATTASLFCTCVLMAGVSVCLLMAGDGSQWGWLGGIIGGVLATVLGIGGGVFGTFCSIRNTKSTMERRFTIRYAIAIWLAVIIPIWLPFSLNLSGVIPAWLQWASFALFFVLLVPSNGWANRRQTVLGGAQGQAASPQA
jgi:hypothetical protein